MNIDKIKQFQNSYPALYTLLSAYFADDMVSDEEILKNYLEEEEFEEIKYVINNAHSFLKKYKPDYIGYFANRFFENEEEEREWFENLIEKLEKEFKLLFKN